MDDPTPHDHPLRPRVVLTFPGQGAQHARMAAGLYGISKSFTSTMDHAFDTFGPTGRTLREGWLAATPPPAFDDISYAQPLLYAVNCAMGTMLTEAGLRPDVLLGHSVGELAAATLASVFSFDCGLRYLSEYIGIYRHAPRGGMLAVAASPKEIEAHLVPGVVIGAVNAPRQVLLSAAEEALANVEAALRRAGITCARARALQPFHHPVMRDIATAHADSLTRPPLHPPHTTLYSAYTGQELHDETATNWQFWTGQPAEPVLFGPTLEYLLSTGPHLVVEAGPGQSLTALVRRTPAVARGDAAALALLPARASEPDADIEAVRAALKQLATLGCDPLSPDF
ncbi:acyltransferase domain-containing protein [Streptomyces samsunensis]|uniref:acyltransferase domain-containing protein n=1 Tax=Streptomyces malaysiensis TaxID=92644 RepID=UPI001583227D|nr:acyltransferase domain-containing protein [Streptomyces samsunensis]NUH41262.1 acyltransferase domain-containing protein [Streptomyces samsunensis]